MYSLLKFDIGRPVDTEFYEVIECDLTNSKFYFKGELTDTEVPHYNDSVCYRRFCCKIEFAVI